MLIYTKEDYIEITEEYKISVYFINLDHNQVENENKNFMASITAQRSDVYESYECTGANPFQSNTLLHEIVQNSGGIVCDEINFSKISETNGLFHTTDNYGDTFYYRGNIENNWFKFAGFYWRIIRINGDDSIRLIYSGKTDETEITRSQYNEEKNGPEMVGYTFIKESSESDSVIKTEVDAWYYENIYKKNFENFIKDTIYCTDRTSYEDPSGKKIIDTYIYKEQYFASYIFLRTNKSPNLYCNNTNDSYTVNDSIHGNTLLKYPVGLITAQEVALAGGVFDKSNQNYYLYTSSWYYTMSPSYYTGELSRIMTVSITGALANDFITGYGGIRPVISINSKNNFTGNGTKENPYEIY